MIGGNNTEEALNSPSGYQAMPITVADTSSHLAMKAPTVHCSKCTPMVTCDENTTGHHRSVFITSAPPASLSFYNSRRSEQDIASCNRVLDGMGREGGCRSTGVDTPGDPGDSNTTGRRPRASRRGGRQSGAGGARRRGRTRVRDRCFRSSSVEEMRIKMRVFTRIKTPQNDAFCEGESVEDHHKR